MPRVPAVSPATNRPTPSYYIHVAASSFVDSAGRVLILRGVNLSGSDKAPVNKPSQQLEGFWETAENGGESFVGRPLDIDAEDGSADLHLARLRGWGFNVVRYVFTWEALEHEGPRKYDYEFMDYTVRVLRKIKEYGFKVFMDPHQDVWSRYSGGSGAPYWTLPACGLNPRNFSATMASIIHSEYPLPNNPTPNTLPAMIWSTNYNRLVSQTVWTLFFAGRQFAPKAIIDGVNIQDWLQSHFIAAVGLLADRIRDAGDLLDECVIGWDSINEPGEGFLGLENINEIPKHQALKKGPTPTPIQGLRLGTGVPQTVENWEFGGMGPTRNGSVTINPAGRSIWADPSTEINGAHPKWGWKRDPGWTLGVCIWALHGVWDPSTGQALIPDYFAHPRTEDGQRIDSPPSSPPEKLSFVTEYWRPHWKRYSSRIRKAHPETIHFIQPPVFVQPPPIDEEDLRGRCAYSAHYYDGLTLMSRHWHWFNADALGLLRGKYASMLQAIRVGEPAIRQSLREQLGILKSDAQDILGPAYPTLIGEIGTPMDMDDKRAYGWTDSGKFKGDYRQQLKALDASLNGADGVNALNYTIWTYCPDSCHTWGDGWNMEDLSLWSRDDMRAQGPSLKASRNYILSPSASDAQLLRNNRSRATSTSSGPDGEERDSKPTTVTAPSPAIFPTESMDSLASAVTVTDQYRLRSRAALPKSSNPASDDEAPKDQPPPSKPFPFPLLPSSLPYAPANNQFAFLTDGARAVGAFARPYPRAIIGTPKTIDFNLGKAEFKFVVTVRPSDALPKEFSAADSPESALATEIYLPVVQFASESYIQWSGSSRPVSPSRASPSERTAVDCDTLNRRYLQNLAAESPDSPDTPQRSRSDTLTSDIDIRPSTHLSSSLTLTRTFPSNPLGPSVEPSPTYLESQIPPEAYNIEVKASAGSWKLDADNQTLKWWYPTPKPGSKDAEYTIVIKRKGGPIRQIVNGTSTRPATAKAQSSDAMRSGWDWCCGMCTIM